MSKNPSPSQRWQRFASLDSAACMRVESLLAMGGTATKRIKALVTTRIARASMNRKKIKSSGRDAGYPAIRMHGRHKGGREGGC
ncbi:hypothetical protein [Neomesorhizobium albiziae]|uniref:hypothetical protein n=1 Tax=Neomesorhizobium albiziae TaxID=335020 RepID=UPI001AEEC47C|nr:hypothetical protein [Mesorhizobium albiziae]